MVPEEKLEKLHDSEKQYLHHYNTILDRYMKTYVPNCKEPLDLTADAEAPEDMANSPSNNSGGATFGCAVSHTAGSDRTATISRERYDKS